MSPYVAVVILAVLSAVVVGAMVSLNTLLGPRGTNPVKLSPFECGNPPTGPATGRFSVRFYMTAILFILFDVEVVFLYPWAVLFRDLGLFGFVEMLTFLLVLGVGLLYAWRKGALEWD
ncbi:MAG: NADH-quinone oxidoreductase subunit A [Candidatus Binatia bacterium]|jgi:NADH-quinone oxidoreductase subunit A